MSKSSKNTNVLRRNVSLSDEAQERGEQLATEDKRSFSNLLEVLIDREWARRHEQQAVKQEVAA